MARVVASRVLFPTQHWSQSHLARLFLDACRRVVPAPSLRWKLLDQRVPQIFERTGIRQRYFLTDPHKILHATKPEQLAAIYTDSRQQLANLMQRACRDVLLSGDPGQDHNPALAVVVTEFPGCPPMDSHVIRQTGLVPDTATSIPLIGLGCAGGAVGLSVATRYLKQFPEHKVLLVAGEHASRIWETNGDLYKLLRAPEATTTNAELINRTVVSAIVGDAAAAVLLGGRQTRQTGHPDIVFLDSASYTLRVDTLGFVGTKLSDAGVEMFLHPSIPERASKAARFCTGRLLDANGLKQSDIQHFVVHPGSARVLSLMEQECGLSSEQLICSYEALSQAGNCMSVSVLHALDLFLDKTVVSPGERGVLVSVGPGMRVEALLFRKE